MSKYAVLHEIQTLDPVRDHQRIVFLSTCYDFPFDTTRALELALFRTFCVPHIAALLDRTREFGERAQKRYDDTDILISEMVEWGYDSDRGAAALARMNAIHGRFRIANDDFLYVLSTFIYEPIRWNARFGWRKMCEQERLALFYFWRAIGERMGIREIPTTYDALERYNTGYERIHFCFSAANRRVGEATREMFAHWFPAPLRSFVRGAIHGLLEPPLLAAFGFAPPSKLTRLFVDSGLKLRGSLVRWLPPRRRPRLRTQMHRRSYRSGYCIADVGPAARTPGKQKP